MKPIFRISGLILLIILIHSCEDKPTPPAVATTAISAISYTTATSGGDATDEGGAPIVSKGVCWNTSADPTISNTKTTESGGLGAFTSNLTQLTPNTLYYVRAYATNSAGTGYGNQISFTTRQVEVPVLTTTGITAITQSTSVSGGNITDDKGGSVTARGVCWGTATNPTTANSKTTDGSGTGSFISNLTGLQPGTIYYVKSYATNSVGTSYGNEISFTTLATVPGAPTIGTATTTAGNAQATVTFTAPVSNGGSAITGYTVTSSPGGFTGTGTSSPVTVTGLTNLTAYTFTVTATNAIGTGPASAASNSVTPTKTVSDTEGNIYNIVTIGTQVWMKENLKSTLYSDGTSIPPFTDNATWAALTTPAYCWYNNDAATYKSTYGALYNWYAVTTGKLCPAGWHVPSDAEWTTLNTYLGVSDAGSKLKETGTSHWATPNTGAANETGFTALPGGVRGYYGGNWGFYNIRFNGFWWSSNEYSTTLAWQLFMGYAQSNVNIGWGNKENGYSVRCVRN